MTLEDKQFIIEQLSHFAKKEDLERFATKGDVTSEIESLAKITQVGFDEVNNRIDHLEMKVDHLTVVVERDHGYELGRLRTDVGALKQHAGIP